MSTEILDSFNQFLSREKFTCDLNSLFKGNPEGFDIDYTNSNSTGGYFSFLFDKALYEDEFKLDYYPYPKPYFIANPYFLNHSIYLQHKYLQKTFHPNPLNLYL